MKRAVACILSALLLLQLSGCIDPDFEITPPDSTAAQTVPQTTPTTDIKEPPIALPIWEGAVERFFAAGADAVVDHRTRDYSYTELQADLAELASAHPDRFSYQSFGASLDGRTLYVALLGNPNAKKQVLVSAGIHGREYLTPLLVMKQIEFYLTYYDVGSFDGIPYAELFEECCFYIVPMSNPDGIMLSQEGLSALRDAALRDAVRAVYTRDYAKRYTTQTDIDEYLKFWKANARGVDLNRNFDALWSAYSGESEPSYRNYKGASPASEPETRALVELTERLANLQAVLCMHSQGEVLYWDCGQSEPLHGETLAFTQAVAGGSGYQVIREPNNDASYSDWCALERGLIAITVETGKGTCPLFIDKFRDIWFDNFDLLPLTAAYFRK